MVKDVSITIFETGQRDKIDLKSMARCYETRWYERV